MTVPESTVILWNLEAALNHFQAGNLVIVVDANDRENEGDLIVAAQDVTQEQMAFMIRHTSGIICVPMQDSDLDRLELPLMCRENTDMHQTAFTITVDLKGNGVTTGVSAADRAKTCRALACPDSTASDFRRPGHVFPLRGHAKGLSQRAGHTEASLELCKRTGKYPAAVICEITMDNGEMARGDDLIAFAIQHSIPLISVKMLQETLTEYM